jgi:hypothetical protein
MADFKTAVTVGARIAALRTARGLDSPKALADSIPGGAVTESVLENIEAGGGNDLTVTQLLNIAWVLRVSPVFLLAPLGSPHDHLDVPGIIPELANLTVAEFDAWVSGIDGAYHPVTADEHSERTQLEALRELLRARREARRLRSVLDLSAEPSGRYGHRGTPLRSASNSLSRRTPWSSTTSPGASPARSRRAVATKTDA